MRSLLAFSSAVSATFFLPHLDSAKHILNHPADRLRTFGFSGRVAIDDATYIGGIQRDETKAT